MKLFIAAVLLALIALLLLWLASRRQQETGLPAGRVIYSDTSGWGKVEKPLFDMQLGLTGRPDYLVTRPEGIIPVEYKSRPAPTEPYDGHIFQLAVYCLLVEKTTGKRPPYGIIRYSNRSFAIDYTPELEDALMDLLAEIRRMERKRTIHRSHDNPALCAGCGYRSTCDQSLAD